MDNTTGSASPKAIRLVPLMYDAHVPGSAHDALVKPGMGKDAHHYRGTEEGRETQAGCHAFARLYITT